MKSLLLAAVLAILAVSPAAAQNRAFDPRAYQDRHAGEATQILVVATMHLRRTPEDFDPAVLEPLLARLQAFQPDAIAIEALPGRSIQQMWNYRAAYPDVATTFGGQAMAMSAAARPGVGMDMGDAEAELRRTWDDWPEHPTAAQRRRRAALFAAAGDPASAVVQWWRLQPSERIADDNVPAQLAQMLDTYATPARRNEHYLIASRLAVRLGLERVYPMDDQSDHVGAEYAGDFYTDLDVFTDEPWHAAMLNSPSFRPLREAAAHLTSADEALATYRMLNSFAVGHADANGQWLNLINRESPHGAGRARVAAWETRNLRMAANIREVAAQFPGGRVLVIVGSAHKPWLDAYLSMMSDVEVANATRALR
ncbi:MAG: DUF5694 domain-containing protein [Hyphomonadaceae bacterium]